jgi:hypothetical protein
VNAQGAVVVPAPERGALDGRQVGAKETSMENGDHERSPDQDLELWKHFAGMGGTDKNTMVTIVSWLLAFAAAAIGYIVTDKDLIGYTIPRISHPVRMMTVSSLGLLVSAVAGYVTLLYGGYANRNWAKADDIADRRGWCDLLPGDLGDRNSKKRQKSSRLNNVAWHWARPCYPDAELAPVFKVYGLLALLGGVAHGVFFSWSVLACSCGVLK